ncbi:MAG TPA: hypothetical protein VEZ47_03655 [Gemmatirosa sp.]|nr:hypothetical protein [Gemmatirosa sp.]
MDRHGNDRGITGLLRGSYLTGRDMREVLGGGLVPVALILAATIHLAMSALLRRMLRGAPADTGEYAPG